ncbi:SirB2 family protein [Pseudorhodoferax sp.]|uniref:SirB2 family protein n=1 Tax=Pseudorhodoferax sp. TaxID=1993553 RepID=UPI0039E6618D
MLAEHYPLIKFLHVLLAMASGSLFAARGLGVLLGAAMPLSPPVRKLAIAVDSALLLAALGLLGALQFAPLDQAWLQVKLVLLVAYIVLGTLALRRARKPGWRLVAYVASLLCFGTMLTVAVRHDPLGWVGLLV